MVAKAAILDFRLERFQLFFYLHVTRCFLLSFESIDLTVSGEEAKDRCSRWPWRPSWIFYRNNFSYFGSTSRTNSSYRVSSQMAFQFTRNRFSRWPQWRQSRISDRTDFSYLYSTCHPDGFYQVLSQLAFRFRRRNET